MPIYEYKCLECDSSIEKIQKISDEPLKICEKCGGKLEKQVSLSGFQFKGAGWYVTDYAGKKPDAKTETKTEAKNEAKAETKTEKTSTNESTTKPETASNPTKSTESNSKKD